ncbi:protein kinase [Actinoplanes sp. NPDC051494]|uniref:serine/threonine-protein kinase n=1 Tax=Actinoplanes sp. NPDC051494 TaxID=3363907 RepID=UPI0037BD48E5
MRLLAGRYRVEEAVGRGGSAVVHRGYDRTLKRRVAIKLFSPYRSADTEPAREVLREAQTAAGLNHPNVARVYDYGEATEGNERVPFLVMEFLDGDTLADHVAREGAFAWPRAAAICADTAAALAAAHERNFVHRDVKPRNVMLTPAGVKVLDFGIAAAAGQNSLDTQGQLWGTPASLAPEQLRGEPTFPAADVYSLGLLLFECLTGRPAWPGQSVGEILATRHQRQAPRLPRIAGLPREVIRLYDSCIAEDPTRRPTASAAAEVLRRAAGRTPTVRPQVARTVSLAAQPSPTPAFSLRGLTSSRRSPASTLGSPAFSRRSPASSPRGPASTLGSPASTLGSPASTLGSPAASLGGQGSSLSSPTASLGGPTSSPRSPGFSLRSPVRSLRGTVSSHGGTAGSVSGPTSPLGGQTSSIGGQTSSIGGPTGSLHGPVRSRRRAAAMASVAVVTAIASILGVQLANGAATPSGRQADAAVDGVIPPPQVQRTPGPTVSPPASPSPSTTTTEPWWDDDPGTVHRIADTRPPVAGRRPTTSPTTTPPTRRPSTSPPTTTSPTSPTPSRTPSTPPVTHTSSPPAEPPSQTPDSSPTPTHTEEPTTDPDPEETTTPPTEPTTPVEPRTSSSAG